MEIRSAEFMKSAHDLAHCPEERFPEFAFIGRSNVGKSTLINSLCKKKHLAHTSSTPGKTQSINHYLINGQWYLVDLPGYGYARVSKSQRSDFGTRIEAYMSNRKTLSCVFVLVDSRIPPQASDLTFMNWLGENSVPFIMILTKSEKVKISERENINKAWDATLEATWEHLPPRIWSSGISGAGRQEILQQIQKAL